MLRQHLSSLVTVRTARGILCLAALLILSSATTARAGVINQLGFALDKSGSISNSEFTLLKTGLHDALAVVPTNGMYEITAVFFGSDVTTVVAPTLINSMANLDAVADAILNYNRTNTGSTQLDDALNDLVALMSSSANHDPLGNQIINVTTDGFPSSQTDAANAADAALLGIIDEISVEAVGATLATVTYLRDQIAGIAPGPAGNGAGIIQPGDPLAPGFVLDVNTAADYSAAIARKVRFIVEPTVPEPTSLAIFGMLGIAAMGRRSRTPKR